MKHRLLKLFAFAAVVWLAFPRAHAAADLFLEEPFGHFGALTATGHAAVYLPRVCAETPVRLRRCHAGEQGVVLSRYNKIAGYDWIAIPLLPYLYAVESPDDVPLFANAKLVAFLRNQYRRKHLEEIAPDREDGEVPGGNWTQLVGAAYDRTLYGYEIETTPEQDDALIRELNSRPNRSQFSLVVNNCADFSRSIIDFYYPHAVHRSIVADVGITTPKQLAKRLVKFSRRHPELESSRMVIPQVPGTVPRSTPVYGVLESFLKSKKYVFPLIVLHPAVTAGMAVAYLGTGRFNPAKEALVYDSSNHLSSPLDRNDRHTYEDQLNSMLSRLGIPRPSWKEEILKTDKDLAQLQEDSQPALDELGRPVLEVRLGEQTVNLGVTRDNILDSDAPPVLAQKIVTSRLEEELRRSAASKTADEDVVNDWNLLVAISGSD